MSSWYKHYKNLLNEGIDSDVLAEETVITAPEPGKDSMVLNDTIPIKRKKKPTGTEKPEHDEAVPGVITEDDEGDDVSEVKMIEVSEPFLNAVINAAVDSSLGDKEVKKVVAAMTEMDSLIDDDDAAVLMDRLRGMDDDEEELEFLADEETADEDAEVSDLKESVIGISPVRGRAIGRARRSNPDGDILKEIRRLAGLSDE